MLESSFGLSFFLKTPRNGGNLKNIYLRITVDGVPRENSTKRKWEVSRWDQKTERAIGTKEDAKALNFFLDSLLMKVNECKTELLYSGKPVTSEKIMDYILGRLKPRVKVLEEFESHNREMAALISKGYAEGTLNRFTITINQYKKSFLFQSSGLPY